MTIIFRFSHLAIIPPRSSFPHS